MHPQTEPDPRLTFDLADRMRRALRVSGISVHDMAEILDVSRNTVGNWINGNRTPRRRDLRAFALHTGIPFEWLENGAAPRPDEGPGGVGLPDLDSNQEPAGSKFAHEGVSLLDWDDFDGWGLASAA